jgi:hypothetical protein
MSVQVNYVSAHDNETLFDVVMLKVCFLEPSLDPTSLEIFL